jgi:hypothetical protein
MMKSDTQHGRFICIRCDALANSAADRNREVCGCSF